MQILQFKQYLFVPSYYMLKNYGKTRNYSVGADKITKNETFNEISG